MSCSPPLRTTIIGDAGQGVELAHDRPARWRRSAMVSNSGTTISSAAASLASSVPRSRPVSFCSSSTSSRSLTVSVWLMM
jgi:hypothetical protein